MTQGDVTPGDGRTVADAVRAELDRMPDRWRTSALAAVALELAHRLDLAPTATSAGGLAAAGIARELHAVLLDLTKLAPEQEAADGVDDLLARRETRRHG